MTTIREFPSRTFANRDFDLNNISGSYAVFGSVQWSNPYIEGSYDDAEHAAAFACMMTHVYAADDNGPSWIDAAGQFGTTCPTIDDPGQWQPNSADNFVGWMSRHYIGGIIIANWNVLDVDIWPQVGRYIDLDWLRYELQAWYGHSLLNFWDDAIPPLPVLGPKVHYYDHTPYEFLADLIEIRYEGVRLTTNGNHGSSVALHAGLRPAQDTSPPYFRYTEPMDTPSTPVIWAGAVTPGGEVLVGDVTIPINKTIDAFNVSAPWEDNWDVTVELIDTTVTGEDVPIAPQTYFQAGGAGDERYECYTNLSWDRVVLVFKPVECDVLVEYDIAPPLRMLQRDDSLGFTTGSPRLNTPGRGSATSVQETRAPRLPEGGQSYS